MGFGLIKSLPESLHQALSEAGHDGCGPLLQPCTAAHKALKETRLEMKLGCDCIDLEFTSRHYLKINYNLLHPRCKRGLVGGLMYVMLLEKLPPLGL